MKAIVDYITVTGPNPGALDTHVKIKLGEGWKLYGDPYFGSWEKGGAGSIVKTEVTRGFYQAMIKEGHTD
ncbi:MAG TPA: DUF1737 domain-containing protein [Verrucomicrobiae bacterium]|nr:DUF1737 domain-containing protein [Verrucomicrobiae bacterium]